jgi:hypothetical protein
MDGWTKVREYGLSHPSGRTIAKCIVNGTPVFMLWQGNDLRGRFDDADAAKAKHADELGLK